MTINLSKEQAITLEKQPRTTALVASNGWTAPLKDYDLKACVLYRDGRQEYIGAANSDEKLKDHTGSVTHGGDVREPGEKETISLTWHPDIDRVALSSYSALENGSGSFNQYGVYVSAKYGDQEVSIPAENASAAGSSYTCLFAEVIYNSDETFTLVGKEDYSRPGSERRVGYKQQGIRRKLGIEMDAGPEGRSK